MHAAEVCCPSCMRDCKSLLTAASRSTVQELAQKRANVAAMQAELADVKQRAGADRKGGCTSAHHRITAFLLRCLLALRSSLLLTLLQYHVQDSYSAAILRALMRLAICSAELAGERFDSGPADSHCGCYEEGGTARLCCAAYALVLRCVCFQRHDGEASAMCANNCQLRAVKHVHDLCVSWHMRHV